MQKTIINFSVATQQFDRHVVIPDIHGEDEILQKVIDIYFDAEDICFVFLGDLIDKRNSKKEDKSIFKTLEIVKNLGRRALVTIANHEWSALGALYDNDPIRRDAHEWGDISFYGTSTTLSSYGVDPESPGAFVDFKKIFEYYGHDLLLKSTTPYYETDKFIATHAGVVNNWDWQEQKNYLEMVASEMSNGIYELQPANWFSTELACDTRQINSTEKIVVSGHAHYLTSNLRNYKQRIKTTADRVVNDGKRVRLASQLGSGKDPLYIWQDWDEQVIEISR